jgi:outer membrane lipopolysaccharide assembly protein LptE/RlpB
VVQYHFEAGVRTKERNKKYIILVEVVRSYFHNPLL